MITNPNIQILEIAAKRLKTLTEEMVFVGGCATGLLLTDPAASTIRPTIDVDVLVEVATLVEYYRLSEQLRQLGFVEDTSEDAPICRWRADDVILDVMRLPILKFWVLGIVGSPLHTRHLNGRLFHQEKEFACCRHCIFW